MHCVLVALVAMLSVGRAVLAGPGAVDADSAALVVEMATKAIAAHTIRNRATMYVASCARSIDQTC